MQQLNEDEEYQPCRFRINGDIVTMMVNVNDMRRMNGLPQCNLDAPYTISLLFLFQDYPNLICPKKHFTPNTELPENLTGSHFWS